MVIMDKMIAEISNTADDMMVTIASIDNGTFGTQKLLPTSDILSVPKVQ